MELRRLAPVAVPAGYPPVNTPERIALLVLSCPQSCPDVNATCPPPLQPPLPPPVMPLPLAPYISAAAAATFARAPFTATLTALAARTLHRRSELCRQWLGVRRLEGLAVLDRLSTRRHAAAHCFARRLVSNACTDLTPLGCSLALTAVATVAHAITAPATVDATAVAILATGPALIG